MILLCVVHPIIQEIIALAMRFRHNYLSGARNSTLEDIKNNPKMHYHMLRWGSKEYLVEYVMVMYRRVMVGHMLDPTASVVAVVLTAVEEAIMRSTLVQRDNLFDWLLGRPEATGADLEHKVRLFAARVKRRRPSKFSLAHLFFTSLLTVGISNGSGLPVLP